MEELVSLTFDIVIVVIISWLPVTMSSEWDSMWLKKNGGGGGGGGGGGHVV